MPSDQSTTIPRRLYLVVRQAPSGTGTTQTATLDLQDARDHANEGALVIEYGKVGLVRRSEA